jgi:hypothetical protein
MTKDKTGCLTRREFLAVSTASSAVIVSDPFKCAFSPSNESSVSRQAPTSQTAITVNLTMLPSWLGDQSIFASIKQDLSAGSYDAIALCGYESPYLKNVIRLREQVNSLHGVRKILVHRPLSFENANYTLEQIHEDSESRTVDGWQFRGDQVDGRRAFRVATSALTLATRTATRAVCILSPTTGVWDHRILRTILALASSFPDLHFVLAPGDSRAYSNLISKLICPATKDSRELGSPNIYLRVEPHWLLGAAGITSVGNIGEDRLIWGNTYRGGSLLRFRIASRIALGTLGRSYSSSRGLNAAAVYSLYPHHYPRNVV